MKKQSYTKLLYRFCALTVAVLVFAGSIAWSAEEIPVSLSDEAFWKMVTDFSEPGGSFPSDDFVSNESGFQAVLPSLVVDRRPGGIYLGVGPEQNFTYISALKPRMAFIFDIRRQNMVEHLVYKALFELSSDRVDFLSRLLSRPKPQNVPENASVEVLVDSFNDLSGEDALFQANVHDVKEQLMEKHGFALTPADEESIGSIMSAFYIAGLQLTYLGPRRVNSTLPTYEQLLKDTDSDEVHRGYLATEENFKTLKEFEKSNLLVPIVGDFAGPTAVRAIGAYLKERNATVTAFYTSNVEQYLFGNDSWMTFLGNIGALPLDSKSVIIRALLKRPDGTYAASPRIDVRTPVLWDLKLFPIGDLLEAFASGKILSYYDAIQNPL